MSRVGLSRVCLSRVGYGTDLSGCEISFLFTGGRGGDAKIAPFPPPIFIYISMIDNELENLKRALFIYNDTI